MTEVSEIFKRDPVKKENELTELVRFLRETKAKYGKWPMRDIITFCAEWQEVTGRLLELGNRPGGGFKFADAEIWRRQLKELEKRGMLKT